MVKKEVLDFYNYVIKPTYNNFITIGSFIYLVVQLIAIFLSIKIGVPEEYRFLTMEIALLLIISSLIYYWIKAKLGNAKNEIIETIKGSIKAKDPTANANENLTYYDIEFAIYCLVKKIIASNFLVYTDDKRKEFDSKKNLIIGIDRGGAIIGGLLGKSLGLAANTLGIYYSSAPLKGKGKETPIKSDKCLEDIDFSSVEKIILVDDAIRAGRGMEAAINVLDGIKTTHHIDYKIACILNVDYRRHIKPDFFIYKTRNIDLMLPWDEMHWDTMQINKEFDEICSKISFGQ